MLVTPSRTKIVRRSADATAINSGTTGTTLTKDDTLKFDVAANERVFVEAILIITAANATMDAKFGWDYPLGTTILWGYMNSLASNPGWVNLATGSSPTGLSVESDSRSVGTAATTFGAYFGAIMRVGAAAGTINLQVAQVTADAGGLKLAADSFLRITRLT